MPLILKDNLTDRINGQDSSKQKSTPSIPEKNVFVSVSQI